MAVKAPQKAVFGNEEELDEAFAEHGEYVLAFVSNIGDLLIVGQNEDGKCFYQGLPTAEDEEGTSIDPNRGWVSELFEMQWPLTLMVDAVNGSVNQGAKRDGQ